ncbi:MAG TPA: hypothetical protein VFK90_14045 [Anaeromyxobacter sp.]|nr:hypothetical protein [Anaeromyxobacter sp.]
MRRAIGGAALAVALSAAAPAAADGGGQRAGAPDLSVAPPERDKVLLLLAKDPDLYAQAVSGTNMADGGRALSVLGVVAIPVGLLFFTMDVFAAGLEAQPGQERAPNRRGVWITAGGVAALAAGIGLIRQGDERRIAAVNAYNQRHAGDPSAR